MIRVTTSVIMIVMLTSAVMAQTASTFTYQGELGESGNPANGSFDMDFALWDALNGGSQVGSTIQVTGQSVSDGLFSVALDFGSNVFDGSQRWLEITVDGHTLIPRQPITATPYSIQTRGIFVDDQNNVGIGTTSPQRNLDIEANEATLRLTTTDPSPVATSQLQLKSAGTSAFTPFGQISFIDESDTLRALIAGNASGPTAATMTFSVTPGETPQMRITSSAHGADFGRHRIKPALAYGLVDSGGTLLSGSSNIISVMHLGTGIYRIDIEGEVESTDVTLVTLWSPGIVIARGTSGVLTVRTFVVARGTPGHDLGFSFVIYRP